MTWWDPGSDPEWLDAVEKLRVRTPKNRTSTYRKDSPNAILGEAGEIVLTDRIRQTLENKGLNWTVGRTGLIKRRSIDLGPCPENDDPWEAIDNSTLGDVHVVDHRGSRRVSFEVKASMTYDNATISESELRYSEAEYLCGITKAGLWICPMEEARRVAKLKRGPFGDFYIIDFDLVQKVSLESIFPDVEMPRPRIDRW